MKKNNNLTKKIARKMCATGAGFLLATAPTLASCESDGVINYALKTDATEFLEEKIDYSNIPNLAEQPLRVIRQAVEGEWKVLRHDVYFPASKVRITKDSVFLLSDSDTTVVDWWTTQFSYDWKLTVNRSQFLVPEKEKIYDMVLSMYHEPCETFPNGWGLSWFFHGIQNDTLCGIVNQQSFGFQPRRIKFLKINDGD